MIDWTEPGVAAAPRSNAKPQTLPLDNSASLSESPKESPELLPGTLDLLILQTLRAGAMHGYGIAQRLKDVSEDVLQVGESSLYPALQRLLLNGWVKAEWGASENNRRARYYTLTPTGRKQLAVERQEFDRIVVAIHKVLSAT
jgi:PadR family transcriptional regulator PadR